MPSPGGGRRPTPATPPSPRSEHRSLSTDRKPAPPPPGPAARPVIRAHAGIRLTRTDTAWTYVPRHPHPAPYGAAFATPKALPQIPAPEVEWMAGWLRHVYATYGRGGTWLQYVDVRENTWQGILPPQAALAGDSRADLSYAGFDPPPDRYRLAGTFRSLPGHDPFDAAAYVPLVDGLHLVTDPASPAWLLLGAYMVAGGADPVPLDASLAVSNAPRRFADAGLQERVRLLDDER